MDWDFRDIILTMLAFFFWFTLIGCSLARSRTSSKDGSLGMACAGRIAMICILPLLGVLLYMVIRPAPTEGERAARYSIGTGYSRDGEISMLAVLHDKGSSPMRNSTA
jgi:hypothetical protein